MYSVALDEVLAATVQISASFLIFVDCRPKGLTDDYKTVEQNNVTS